MKSFHNITFSVFEKIDIDKVKDGLISLFPFSLDDEKLSISKKTVFGINGKPITTFELFIDKERHISQFLKFLLGKLTIEQKKILIEQLESRLDDECKFFIRFDKTKLVDDKELVLTDSGDCFHLKFTVAAYPKTRESAKKVLKSVFEV